MHRTRTRGWLHNHDHAREHAAESARESDPNPGHHPHCTNCTNRIHYTATPVEPTSKYEWDDKQLKSLFFSLENPPHPRVCFRMALKGFFRNRCIDSVKFFQFVAIGEGPQQWIEPAIFSFPDIRQYRQV